MASRDVDNRPVKMLVSRDIITLKRNVSKTKRLPVLRYADILGCN